VRAKLRLLTTIALTVAIAACTDTPSRAPVIDRGPDARAPGASVPALPAWKPGDPRPATHSVQKGETIYSISQAYGLSAKDLIEWNGLDALSTIRLGQQLRLSPPEATVSVLQTEGAETPPPQVNGQTPGDGKTTTESKAASPPPPGGVKSEPKGAKAPYSAEVLAQMQRQGAEASAKEESAAQARPEVKAEGKNAAPASGAAELERVDWGWPAKGSVAAGFTEASKGLQIRGTLGQPILASAAGQVTYVGASVRGFGKMVVIKHNRLFLSVYAHNNQILVKEGQAVTKGQKIAEMGNTDSDQIKLHFEIRRLGKPVDPLKYLPGDRPS
jgi:lipoprotein NlpD